MGIVKPKDYVEAYRARVQASDINELSGRTGRPDLTTFVSANIVQKLKLSEHDSLVDIGCGDGSALAEASKYISPWSGRLVGLLPTDDEVIRVREHLITKAPFVNIARGRTTDTGLPNEFADKVISNGVFLILVEESVVDASLREIARICKPGATIFIGELPDTNELSGKTYDDSITLWLYWVLVNQGVRAFLHRLAQVIKCLLTTEPFIISPKTMFWMEPSSFRKKLESHGFNLLECYRHLELDTAGNIIASHCRFDYVITKASTHQPFQTLARPTNEFAA